MKNQNVHSGHRERARALFLKRDFSSMPDHEILEILLFFAHPRNDTNALAHELIKVFGNLENVLSAPYEELVKIKGIGDSAAVLLILFSKLSVRYCAYLQEDNGCKSNSQIEKELVAMFQHESKELVMAVLFDAKGKLMNISQVGKGGINDASFRARELIEIALRCNASKIILAHNHPQSFAVPSAADIETTRGVKRLLRQIDIELLDHWIIAGSDSFSMKDSKKYCDIF